MHILEERWIIFNYDFNQTSPRLARILTKFLLISIPVCRPYLSCKMYGKNICRIYRVNNKRYGKKNKKIYYYYVTFLNILTKIISRKLYLIKCFFYKYVYVISFFLFIFIWLDLVVNIPVELALNLNVFWSNHYFLILYAKEQSYH